LKTFRKALLVQPMHEKLGSVRSSSISFPWGLAYIAACMQREGCTVEVLDGQALQLPKEQLAGRIDPGKYDLIGITAFSTQFHAVRLLSGRIRSGSAVPVVIGGPLATYQPELVLSETTADVCVIGEGELTVTELLRGWDDLSSVTGIAHRCGERIALTPPREEQVDLDRLPFPDLGLFDMERYVRKQNPFARRHSRGRSIAMITSRGCPYSCNFCSKSSRSYRSMSADRIYEMLRWVRDELKIDEVAFGDELFLSSRKRFAELAPRLRSLGLPWGAQARVNLVDEGFLDLAKGAGCVGIGYGIESGSQKILDNMNKRITVDQIERAMRHTMRIGIPVKVQLIFGYPGEDADTVAETVQLFDRLDHPGRRFNVITPIPGSALYAQCREQGLIRDEVGYLAAIEKSFGRGRVHVNFTPWPDEEIYPRKRAAEEAMRANWVRKSAWRRARNLAGRLLRRVRK
jgi:radical SAM superfamily enzyme YgiQ (UPF0313 family)